MPSLLRARAQRSRQMLAFVSLAALVVGGIPQPALATADEPSQRLVEIGGASAAEMPEFAPKPEVLTVDPPGLTRVMEPNGQGYAGEAEPNGTAATATPIVAPTTVRANVWPAADVDFYSFTATAGDRVYAATMTSASAANSDDSTLQLIASDGTTVLEVDNDNGSFSTLSSSIAGTVIPTTGTYFLRVAANGATLFLRPYELYLRLQSGAPTAEVEPNDTALTANPLPPAGWVSGARNPANDLDFFSFTANAGDTVFLSLDLDPEDDGVAWNGFVGLGAFGDPGNQFILIVDDNTADTGNRISEAFFMTVKASGTYTAVVGSQVAAAGPTQTYHMSVTVRPPVDEGVNCTTYTSTDVPKAIGPTQLLTSSVITVPGNPRIADLDVTIQLNHQTMSDLDVHLRSPAGNDNGLFTDPAWAGPPNGTNQLTMDLTLDDEAAFLENTAGFTIHAGLVLKPESNQAGAATASASGGYRLNWFDGENAGGTWTLDIRDDTNGQGGNLTAWSMRICEPPPPPACAPGFGPVTVFSTDFEGGAAGFTHSGTADEWELGLPATLGTTTTNPIAAFNTCNSGVNCWKTDLDNTYNVSSNQNLLSPAINLAGFSAPVVVQWAQRHQLETATYDHFSVDYQQVGGATPVRLFEWLDPTPISVPGAVNVAGSAGWGVFTGRADSLAGLNTELRFHVDTDSSINFAGVAIDDVSVTACRPLSADLQITKTDGLTQAAPGQLITYTITASNAGPDAVTGATVADTFPGQINCPVWSCVGAGGGTCTASGSGNINDTVNLPAGGSATYTASCGIGTNASGSIANTATVSSSVADPVPGNNSATDTDVLVPEVDVAITKTDGVTTATAGGSVTYTIVASNAGPSNAAGATVADTFPASLTCNWTCTPGFGSTCTPAGSGNINDTVNIGASDSVTYTATCNVSASATGSLSNTATVTSVENDTNPGNNSATDVDTLVASNDVSITKTDGVTSATPGGSVTYTITASNAGPSDVTGATVADTFPASLTCTWTCVGAGGGTCTAAGSGNINDTVNLPAGGSVTYTSSCSISASATGTLSNTATVSATDDPVPGNNSATDVDTLVASNDVSITKTDGVTSATPGGSVTYTITASNAGPSDVTGATVADTFPASLTCTWTCVGAGGGTCTASGSGNISDTVNLPAGGSVTYTSSCSIAPSASGTLSNTATVTAAGDPVPGNNSATDTDTLTASADLGITKSDGVTAVRPGDALTYAIGVSNSGPSDAVGAVVADTVPSGLTGCTWTCTPGLGSTCAATGSGNINDTVTVAAGSTLAYSLACTVAANAPTGPLGNTATVAFAGDPTPGNNSATDTDTVTGSADIAVTKTVNNPTPTVGSNVTYTVTATNNGPAAATGVVVTDLLPAGLTFVSSTPSAGAYTPATGAWTIGTLANGANATLALVATVTRSETIVNQATRTAGNETDPNRANNTGTVSINGPALADVQVQETVDDTTPGNGQNVTFTVTARNAGPSNATGVVISDNLPAGLTFVSATPSQGTYANATGVWTVGSISNGATATLQVVMTVTTTLPTTRVVNKTAQTELDVEASNDSDSVTLNDQGSADLALSMVASQEPVTQNTTFTYTIVVVNHGPISATSVTVTDSLPSGLAFVSAQATQGSCTGTTSVSCTLGTLPDGGSASIALQVTKTVGGSVSNSASVTATEADPYMPNNTNGETTTPVSLLRFKVE